jgi:hypothetical protein
MTCNREKTSGLQQSRNRNSEKESQLLNALFEPAVEDEQVEALEMERLKLPLVLSLVRGLPDVHWFRQRQAWAWGPDD